MNARAGLYLLLLLAMATLGCKTANHGRCNGDSDCGGGQTCSATYCVPKDAGFDAVGGAAGAMGGAGGSMGGAAGGKPSFTCPNNTCQGAVPICEVDAGCRGCATNTACHDLDAGTNVCVTPDASADASTGTCVGCLMDSDCLGNKPICDKATNRCRACKADSECTGGPGVCMFQSDGHCATDAETVYVHSNSVASNCPSPSTAGAGTATSPFCDLTDALAAAGTRSLLVLRGGSIPGGTTIQSGSLSIVGQQSATINPGASQAGIHVSSGSLYVRGVEILSANSAATIGIIADGTASIQLDGVDIENMPQGGLRVTAGASYDVINSIFAGNGGTKDDGNRFIGGAWLLDATPAVGQATRFAFNTVVSNNQAGVICASASQTIDASLLAKNLGGGANPDYSGCTLATTTSKALGTTDPMLTATHRATATSPCLNFVSTPPANPPDHDIDAISRPQGIAFDCGASEYKAP